jgi:hypothetical protein
VRVPEGATNFFLLRPNDVYIIIGFIILAIGIAYGFYSGIVHGASNSTSNMTLQCVRMFYSDSWDKGYVVDLAKFCDGKDIG